VIILLRRGFRGLPAFAEAFTLDAAIDDRIGQTYAAIRRELRAEALLSVPYSRFDI
jgi:hypothetical protein